MDAAAAADVAAATFSSCQPKIEPQHGSMHIAMAETDGDDAWHDVVTRHTSHVTRHTSNVTHHITRQKRHLASLPCVGIV